MQSSKFIEILKTYSPAEFKRFGLMIRSPYFNSEKVLITLFGILKKHYPTFSSKALDREKVFRKLYPSKKYNDALMRNVFSDMLKLCEEFLLCEKYRTDEFKSRIQLMDEYSIRGLMKLYEKTLQKAEQSLQSRRVADIGYYKNKLLLELAKSSHENLHIDKYIKPGERDQQISDNITTIFLMEMLFRNISMLNRQTQITNFNYRLNFEDEIESFLSNKGGLYLKLPYIRYYFYTYMLLKTREEKYYYLLKGFADSEFETLSADESRNVFTVLTNYCYTRLTGGEDQFMNEQFALYKKMIERNIHVNTAGKVSNVLFMNAVVTGLECGEQNWVEKFILSRADELKEDSRSDTISFCNALICYHKKDYGSAGKFIASIRTEDLIYKHNIRSLYLKILFDTNDIEPFLSHVDSYKHFIAKNKQVFDRIREHVNNYITFSKRIFSIKNQIGKFDEFDLEGLKLEITGCKSLINRTWLLRKIEEMT